MTNFQVQSLDRLTEDAPLAYSIVSGNMDAAFDIDNNGRITTAQELDYEIENVYKLKVIGTGNVKKTPETDVEIRGFFFLIDQLIIIVVKY